MTAEFSDVVRIARDLIRFDTTNYGGGRANSEREAAEYVAALLTDLGLTPELYEAVPGRTNVHARIAGHNPELPALILHGHLDVVPAIAEDWTHDPFSGHIDDDGMLWGRGAVDMKGMDAMILAAIGDVLRAGEKPQRDIIITFFADEENGGVEGSTPVVAERPDWFEGAKEAISEVGGYSISIDGRRAYLLQVGEKALLWLRLSATGRAGHGSGYHPNNAVTRLAEAVAALGRTEWPVTLTPTTEALLAEFQRISGSETTDPDQLAQLSGPAQGFIRSSLRTTTNPTGLEAGYKHNVIPDKAQALIDVRVLPGTEAQALEDIQRIVGEDIEIEVVVGEVGLEVPFAGDLVDTMVACIGEHDPRVPVIPYLLGGGTDNKALSRLGIAGFGFAPMRLPEGLDFTGMFHGVDERVPTDALEFGKRVLADLIRRY